MIANVRNLSLVLLASLITMMLASPAFALERAFVEHYKNRNYARAKESAKKAIEENKEDGVAYYYLGHSHVKLNDTKGATKAYHAGLRNCEDVQLRDKIAFAWESLVKHHQAKIKSARDKTLSDKHSQKNKLKGAFPGENAAKFEAKLDRIAEEKRAAILKELEKRLTSERRRADDRIRILRRKQKEAAASVPRIFNEYYDSLDYHRDVEKVQERYEDQIEDVNERYERWSKKCQKEADQKFELILHSRHNLSQHYQNANSTTRLTPRGSCLHIRNYVNFNGYQRPTGQKTTVKMGKLGVQKYK